MEKIIKFLGWILFVLVILLLFTAHLQRRAEKVVANPAFEIPAEWNAPGLKVTSRNLTLPGQTVPFLMLEDQSGTQNYVFNTKYFAPDATGYGGKINLLVRAGKNGKVKDFKVVKHQEGEEFLDQVLKNKAVFLGKNIFSGYDKKDLDSMSGATYTAKGISTALHESGKNFSAALKGKTAKSTKISLKDIPVETAAVVFIIFCALAVIVRWFITTPLRRFFLIVVLVTLGIAANIQYSTDSMASLLEWQFPSPGLTGPFLLAAILPLFLALFGNVYCGYICPFGALQEILAYLNLSKFHYRPPRFWWVWLRLVKYILLAGLGIWLILSFSRAVFAGDVLRSAFSTVRHPVLLGMIVGLMILSLFFTRFWCRNLCPAGAFLSLFNKLKILARIFPKPAFPQVKPGYCDLGVRHPEDLDCLNCDRCRINKELQSDKDRKTGIAGIIYIIAVIVYAALIIWMGIYSLTAQTGDRSRFERGNSYASLPGS